MGRRAGWEETGGAFRSHPWLERLSDPQGDPVWPLLVKQKKHTPDLRTWTGKSKTRKDRLVSHASSTVGLELNSSPGLHANICSLTVMTETGGWGGQNPSVLEQNGCA